MTMNKEHYITQHCGCNECSSNQYTQQNYFVDTFSFANKAYTYKKGLSGILRVKNEEDFLDLCIASCVKALDELIIVVQPSQDKSLDIAKKYQQKYPKKIKLFEYLPSVDSPTFYERNNKDVNRDQVIERAETVHGAANYYNFAQSKVTHQYTIKIDADQVYFTEKLNLIRNLFKQNIIGTLAVKAILLKNLFNFKKFIYLIKLISKLNRKNNAYPMFYGINLFNLNNNIISFIPTCKSFNINNKPIVYNLFNGGWDYNLYNSANILYKLNPIHLYEQAIHYNRIINGGILFLHAHSLKLIFKERLASHGLDFTALHDDNASITIDKLFKLSYKKLQDKYYSVANLSDFDYEKIKNVKEFWDGDIKYFINNTNIVLKIKKRLNQIVSKTNC